MFVSDQIGASSAKTYTCIIAKRTFVFGVLALYVILFDSLFDVGVPQVKVPDPEVAVRLEASEEKNDKLQKENANLQIKIDSLQKELSDAKEAISELEAKVCTVLNPSHELLSYTQPSLNWTLCEN